LHLADDPLHVSPEPSLVIGSLAASGNACRLAREARNDRIHDSTPRDAVEGGEIRPDRALSQFALSHLRDQTRHAERFPLHHADRASILARQSQSVVESGHS
jgi:hypothetical protein